MYRIDNILNLYNVKSICRYFMIKAFSPCPVVVGIMFRRSGRKNRFRNFELDTFRTSFNLIFGGRRPFTLISEICLAKSV